MGNPLLPFGNQGLRGRLAEEISSRSPLLGRAFHTVSPEPPPDEVLQGTMTPPGGGFAASWIRNTPGATYGTYLRHLIDRARAAKQTYNSIPRLGLGERAGDVVPAFRPASSAPNFVPDEANKFRSIITRYLDKFPEKTEETLKFLRGQ